MYEFRAIAPDRFQQFCWNSRSAAIDRRACRGTRRAAIDEDFGGLDVRSIVGRQEQHGPGAALSGKLVLAAKPEVFLRFQLRHPEQMAEHVELVAPRQPGKVSSSLCDKGRGLIRPALLAWFIGSRTLVLRRRYPLPPSPCLGQKTNIQYRVLWRDTSSECATLGRIPQLFRY
jgi:hypothetical protein